MILHVFLFIDCNWSIFGKQDEKLIVLEHHRRALRTI